ncbi:interleukin-22 receptor subunit alpha-1 isoform X2 [Prinia subflava]|uniref:interleukin-22 receptor subunit alpha-1 isoform X2 n=1 Tax=Prinia subflava TaxID=208062 RepID=UPI002FE2FDDB
MSSTNSMERNPGSTNVSARASPSSPATSARRRRTSRSISTGGCGPGAAPPAGRAPRGSSPARRVAIIGAPQVEHIPHVRSIRLVIRPPPTPLRGEDGQQLTVEDICSKFGAVDYHLTMFNRRTQQQWTKSEHSKEFEVSNLDPDTEYNGTVYMGLLQRRSKPQMFWVKTLPDKTWILYCLVALAFCAGLVFAAGAYVIYKYIKQRSAQPRALDFRGISPFQPLTLTVEHIIKPLTLSKPSFFIPEAQLAQMSQHLEAPRPFCPYQQQADVPSLRPAPLEMPAPGAYAPQAAARSVPAAPGLPLTYGLCVQGTDRGPQPQHGLKEASPDGKLRTQELGKSCGRWDYTEQQAKVWKDRDRLESVVIQGSPGQPQLLVQSEGKAECVSLSVLEQGGCYRQQAELPLRLSAAKAAPDCAPEEELLPPLPAALLLSVRTANGESQEQWMLPEPSPHPANRAQLPGTAGTEMFPELSSGSAWDTDTPLAMLFKDLDLKVQWDEEDGTEFY